MHFNWAIRIEYESVLFVFVGCSNISEQKMFEVAVYSLAIVYVYSACNELLYFLRSNPGDKMSNIASQFGI